MLIFFNFVHLHFRAGNVVPSRALSCSKKKLSELSPRYEKGKLPVEGEKKIVVSAFPFESVAYSHVVASGGGEGF